MGDFGDEFTVALLAFLAFLLLGMLLVFVVWPLLALAIELLILLLLLLAGLISRVVFRKPWTVEARSSNGLIQCWQVRGYGPMRQVVREVSESLRRGESPAPEGAQPVLVPRPQA